MFIHIYQLTDVHIGPIRFSYAFTHNFLRKPFLYSGRLVLMPRKSNVKTEEEFLSETSVQDYQNVRRYILY